MRLSKVYWTDAHFDQDDPDKPREKYTVQTVGWVKVKKSSRFLRVKGEKLPGSDGYRAVTSIPIENVIKIVDLEERG